MYAVLFLLVVMFARGGGGGHGGGHGGGGRGGRGGIGRSISSRGLRGALRGGSKGLDKATRNFANSKAVKAGQRDFSRLFGSRLSPGQRAIIKENRPSFEKYNKQILEKGPFTRSAHERFWKDELGTSKYQAVERPLRQMHRESASRWLKDFQDIYKFANQIIEWVDEDGDDIEDNGADNEDD